MTWPALFKICRLRTREEAKQIYDAGMLFLRQHVELSKIAQSRRLLIWVSEAQSACRDLNLLRLHAVWSAQVMHHLLRQTLHERASELCTRIWRSEVATGGTGMHFMMRIRWAGPRSPLESKAADKWRQDFCDA